MSSSLFERTRALHADVEESHTRLLDTMNQYSLSLPTQARVLLDQKLKAQYDSLRASQDALLQLYEDKEGARAAELRALTGGPGSATGASAAAGGGSEQLWTTFYDALAQIRQYHSAFPNAARVGAGGPAPAGSAAGTDDSANDKASMLDALDSLTNASRDVHFSVEECFGKHVDMHALHERFINLPHFDRHTDYRTFLAALPTLGNSVARERKLKAHPHEYRKFLQSVLDYFLEFHQRISPLADTEVLRRMMREEFDKLWEARQMPGWFDDAPTAAAAAAVAAAPAPAAVAAAASDDQPGDASAAAGASSEGAPVLDASNPLYCVACAKLFAKDSVFAAHLTGKKHKKNEDIRAALQATAAANGATTATEPADGNASAEGQPNSGAPAAASKLSSDLRSLALLEFEVRSFAGLLSSQLDATRMWLTKKQTRTFDELAADLAASEADVARAKALLAGKSLEGEGAEEESDEEEDASAPIYNPLNLPLGFDGKPIPYWLYKLHGLNLKFTCEICGNYTYAGPRNFERHFSEWRHAYGMRALGIPNTRHFAHITSMADAHALFDKLKREGVGAGFRPDDEQEFEDADGNVFNKRTFVELQRQGLV